MWVLSCTFAVIVFALEPAFENQWLWKKGHYNFSFDEASHALSHKALETEDAEPMNSSNLLSYFQISLKGVTVVLQQFVEVFYAHAMVDSQSVAVELLQGTSVVARCTNLQLFVNSALFDLRECVGSALDTSGSFIWRVSGFANGAAVSELFPFTRYVLPKYPWPLQNDQEPWPPSLPNLAGNIVEVNI